MGESRRPGRPGRTGPRLEGPVNRADRAEPGLSLRERGPALGLVVDTGHGARATGPGRRGAGLETLPAWRMKRGGSRRRSARSRASAPLDDGSVSQPAPRSDRGSWATEEACSPRVLPGASRAGRAAPTGPPRAARSAWPPAEAPLTRSLQGTRRPRSRREGEGQPCQELGTPRIFGASSSWCDHFAPTRRVEGVQ